MNYRNPKLTRLANGAPCVLCGSVGTTVWAHSNAGRHGKGMGIKAHDCYGALLCAHHHNWYDSGSSDRAVKLEMFREAMEKTTLYLWKEGLIRVA